MAITDDITGGIGSLKNELKTKLAGAVSAMNALDSSYFNTANSDLQSGLTAARGVLDSIAGGNGALTEAQTRWDRDLVSGDTAVNPQSKSEENYFAVFGDQSFETYDYLTHIIDVTEKNITDFTRLELSAYNAPIWTDYEISNSDFGTDLANSYVSLQTFDNYVNRHKERDALQLNTEILSAGAKLSAKGFTFPNSSLSMDLHIMFSKYINDLREEVRRIWEGVASKLNSSLETQISGAIGRLDQDISFNASFARLESSLSDTFLSLEGILNDINIRKYALTEDQLQQIRQSLYEKESIAYKAYLQREAGLLKGLIAQVEAEWDAEVRRAANELNAYRTNAGLMSAEFEFLIKEWTDKFTATYNALSKDIGAYESTFASSYSGLTESFKMINALLSNISSSVISIIKK